MSDRVTNVEIEDVLTSIRKLVADGEWIRQRAAEANAAKAPQGASGEAEAIDDAGRFVLTPALRVIENSGQLPERGESSLRFGREGALRSVDSAEAETALTDMADDLSEDAEDASDASGSISDILEMIGEDGDETDLAAADEGGFHSLGAAIAELEAAVDQEGNDWEPDGSETVLNDMTAPLRVVGGAEMPDVARDELDWAAPDPEVAEEEEVSIESLIAEEVGVTDRVEAAESEEAPLDLAFFARPRERFSAPSQPTPADKAAEIEEAEPADEEDLSFAHLGAAQSDEAAEIAASEEDAPEMRAEVLEAAVAFAAEQAETFTEEPDFAQLAAAQTNEAAEITAPEEDAPEMRPEEPEAAMGDAADEGEAFADEAAFDEIADEIAGFAAEEAAAAVADEAADDLSAYLSDEVALDEETLRELLSEVVRRELEGELGERITRNVRKLVRREVNKALEGRGLV